MKITYNFGQDFELVEIDMCFNVLIFKTNNGMGLFAGTKRGEETTFEVPFESIYELQNIPKLLWDYLDKNNLMYWCD